MGAIFGEYVSIYRLCPFWFISASEYIAFEMSVDNSLSIVGFTFAFVTRPLSISTAACGKERATPLTATTKRALLRPR